MITTVFVVLGVIAIILLVLKAIKTGIFLLIIAAGSWFTWHTISDNAKVPPQLESTVKAVKANPTVKKLASEASATEQQVKQHARAAIVSQVDALLGTKETDPSKRSAGEPIKAAPTPDQKVQQLLKDQHTKVLSKPMDDNVLNAYFQGYPGSKEMFELFKTEMPNAKNVNNAFLKFYESIDASMRKPALSPQEVEQIKLKIKTYVQNKCEGLCP